MGGVWEHIIGIICNILDSMILEVQLTNLTHEVLFTVLAEVYAIVNGRPIVPVSSDPKSLLILSPAVLLTQKTVVTLQLLENLIRRICIMHFGDECNIWQIFSCNDGTKSIFKLYKHVENGQILLRIEWRRYCAYLWQNVLKDEWPTGIIVNPLPGHDGRVRKADVCVARNGSTYTRPISEIVLLLRV